MDGLCDKHVGSISVMRSLLSNQGDDRSREKSESWFEDNIRGVDADMG